jgi:uncharacterized repeat protein (TIGR01451 family)
MRNVEFEISKTSYPESGTLSEPQAVDRNDQNRNNQIVYTVTVENAGTIPGRNVTVVDILPGGVVFDAAAIRYYTGDDASRAIPLPTPTPTAPVRATLDGKTLTFVIAELNARQVINFIIPGTVEETTPFGTMILNSATITSINGAVYGIESGTTYHSPG